MKWDKIALVAGGLFAGTAGLKVFTSKDAKKVYTHITAAVLRAKDSVMTTVAEVRENVDDIVADAKQINEDRIEETLVDAEFAEDVCECCSEETTDTGDAESEALSAVEE